MKFEINKDRIRAWRRWLAAAVTPAPAVPQPATVSVLAAVFFNAVRYVDGRELIDVAPDLDDAYGDRLIVRDTDGQWMLTDLGEQELAKWWGPDRVPPWAYGTLGSCDDHGDYDSHPGDPLGCPRCAMERALRGCR